MSIIDPVSPVKPPTIIYPESDGQPMAEAEARALEAEARAAEAETRIQEVEARLKEAGLL